MIKGVWSIKGVVNYTNVSCIATISVRADGVFCEYCSSQDGPRAQSCEWSGGAVPPLERLVRTLNHAFQQMGCICLQYFMFLGFHQRESVIWILKAVAQLIVPNSSFQHPMLLNDIHSPWVIDGSGSENIRIGALNFLVAVAWQERSSSRCRF